MRKIAANFIFPVNHEPIKNGILVVDDDGVILDLIDPGQDFKELNQLEYYNGILVPGFVNTHCHLELSFFKGKIGQGKGLTHFIDSVQRERTADKGLILNALKKWDGIMHDEGIVAVGDISNDSVSFPVKSKSTISYVTFIEVFGTDASIATTRIDEAKKLQSIAVSDYGLKAFIAPHASYSAHPNLINLLKDVLESSEIISIHNQECNAENKMFESRTGTLFEKIEAWGGQPEKWYPLGTRSPQIHSGFIPHDKKVLFVHNTYSNAKDIDYLSGTFKKAYFSLCPGSNLFIENKLPDISVFNDNNRITIGTDSLASNNRLSVLNELKIIQTHFPETSLQDLIKWATLNGADALGMEKSLGSFEKGKKPGVLLIDQLDLSQMRLLPESRVKRLI